MGTTLTAVALAGATAYVAHVGDSRLYRLRQARLVQLTQDHSEVADLVRMKIVKPELASQHPSRDVLTRTVGHQLLLRPDFAREPVLPDDRFLLCTDGVWSVLGEHDLQELLATLEPEAACRQIINRCLERHCGDNVSVQIVRVLELDSPPERRREGFLSGILRPLGRG